MAGTVEDLLEPQSRTAQELASAIHLAIFDVEMQNVSTHPLPTLASYSLLLGSVNMMHRSHRLDFERAKVLLALALKNRDRQRELAKFGGAALRDQQQAETDYITAEVEQQRASERLRQIGVEPQTTSKSRTVTITSPIAGSVIELAVAPGAYWNDANAPLMTIADQHGGVTGCSQKDTPDAKGQPVDVASAYPDMAQG
jgi:multidrug efflux pump subunit AcrA (membrane-fusion protein)